MKLKNNFATCVLLTASFGASAQSMKPGLWEINNKTQMGAGTDNSMAQMQQQMASMPPDQRKMMEDMMAKQGLSMGSGARPGVLSVRVCITKEMAERDQMPSAYEGCQNTVLPRSGNSLKFSFRCTNPPSSGEGQTTFISPEEYTMKMTVNTAAQGKPEKISMDGSGKWLSADCGVVKPMPMTRK